MSCFRRSGSVRRMAHASTAKLRPRERPIVILDGKLSSQAITGALPALTAARTSENWLRKAEMTPNPMGRIDQGPAMNSAMRRAGLLDVRVLFAMSPGIASASSQISQYRSCAQVCARSWFGHNHFVNSRKFLTDSHRRNP